MWYLISAILLIVVLDIVSKTIDVKNNHLLKYGSFLIVFALYVFADLDKFPDIEYYSSLFDNASNVSWLQIDDLSHYEIEYKFEFGWCVLVKFFNCFLPDSRCYIEIIHLLIITCYWTFIFKYSKNHCFSILLFVFCIFYNSIFVIRQNLVVAICYLLLPLILERRFKEFLIILLLLMQIHTSAIVFLPMYFLLNVSLDKKYVIALLIIAVIVFVQMENIIYLFASNFSWYGNAAMANELLEDGEDASNSTTLIISASIFVYVLFITRFKNLTKLEYLLVHGLVLAIFINFVRIGSFASLGRLASYFYNGVIVLIPNVSERIKSKPVRYCAIMGILVLYAYGAFRSLNYGYHW